MPNKKSSEPVGWGEGYVVFENTPRMLTGKVITLLETLGLPTKQEDAIKSLVHQAIDGTFYEDAIFISSERHTEIRNLYRDKRSEAGNSYPVEAI